MEIIDALILGIVQGLAEYLPISSSGHLVIFREILGIDIPADQALQFDLILHAATVLSTIVILWPMFSRLCKSFFTFRRDADFWYVCKILVSCIPVGIVGVFFKDMVEEAFGTGVGLVGTCMLFTAILLIFAHYSDRLPFGGMKKASAGRDIGWWDALTIGVAQAIAVLPGLSRSGTTIATGIIIGDKRDKVAAFSFLMVIIPILGEALLDIKDMMGGAASETSVGATALIVGFLASFLVGCAACKWMLIIPILGEALLDIKDMMGGAASETSVGATALIVGFLASFLVGCAACKWMLNLVRKGKLVWFALYCAIVGLICIAWNVFC